MKTGLKPGVKTYDFVLEHPSALEEIQRGYLQAGSDSVIAATFGIAEGTHPIDADKVRRVVEISRKVCGGSPLGLDLSPIGKYLYPYGDGDFEAAAERYGAKSAPPDSRRLLLSLTSIRREGARGGGRGEAQQLACSSR